MTRQALRPGFRRIAFAWALSAVVAGKATAIDPELARFATAKQAQVREYAQGLTSQVPSLVWSFFDAVRLDDWETATNLGARLSRASGRYAGASSEESMSPALRTLIWPPISEMIGACNEFHDWDNKWLHRFGREIIDSVPRGSIYFGGTDPGRFIISALCESQREGKPFFTLTQNQLVDQAYLDYLRRMYGDRLSIPTTNDEAKAFQDYLTNAQQRLKEGKLKPGEDVRVVDGRVQVSGQVAVMEINALLARMIVSNNPSREVYVEESFPLDWMYPCLSPHGLVFEVHAKPMRELGAETVQKDQDYWKRLVGELIGDWITEKTSVKEVCDFSDRIHLNKDMAGFKGDPGFAKNKATQRCLSKLRSAIGGLYAWRAEQARDADEKARMSRAADLAFRQAYALCPSLPETVFRYAYMLASVKRGDDAFLVGKTSLRLDPENASLKDLVRSLRSAE